MRGNIDLYGVPHGVSVGMRCPHVRVDHDSPLYFEPASSSDVSPVMLPMLTIILNCKLILFA